MEVENPTEQLENVENNAEMESTDDDIHRIYQDAVQNFSKELYCSYTYNTEKTIYYPGPYLPLQVYELVKSIFGKDMDYIFGHDDLALQPKVQNDHPYAVTIFSHEFSTFEPS